MKSRIAAIFGLLLLPLLFTQAQNAGTAGAFARMGAGARGMGMGNALTAVISGDKDALPGYKELGDRLEGKPMQPTEITGGDGEPVTVRVIGVTPVGDR